MGSLNHVMVSHRLAHRQGFKSILLTLGTVHLGLEGSSYQPYVLFHREKVKINYRRITLTIPVIWDLCHFSS